MENKKGNEGKSGADLIKRLINTGLGAALMTEDLIKGAISDIPLPKELLEKILQNAKNSKEEVVDRVGKVVDEFLHHIDWRKELDRVLDNYDVEMRASFRLRKKKQK